MEALSFAVYGILVIVSTTHATLYIKPEKQTLVVLEGEKLELQCVNTYPRGQAPQSVSLQMNDTLDKTLIVVPTVEKDNENVDVYKYTQEPVSVNDSGKYACSIPGQISTIQVRVYKPPVIEDIIFKAEDKGKTLNLSCELGHVGGTKLDYDVSWTHNNQTVNEEGRYRIVDHVLQITPAERTDMGDWVCTVTFFPHSTTDSQSFIGGRLSIFVTPEVVMDEHDKNLVEDDDLDLECTASGYPTPDIMWFRDDTLLSKSVAERIQILPFQGSDQGRLKVFNLIPDDAGWYRCVASSTINNMEETAEAKIRVRVKSKYAALWPAIGIIIELIILFVIIWCSQRKKKSKWDDDDADAPIETEKPGEDMGSAENVRHRIT